MCNVCCCCCCCTKYHLKIKKKKRKNTKYFTWASSVSLYIGGMRLRPHLFDCILSKFESVWKTDDDDDGYKNIEWVRERKKKKKHSPSSPPSPTYNTQKFHSLAFTITGWCTNNWLASRNDIHLKSLHQIVLLHAVSSRFCLSLCVYSYIRAFFIYIQKSKTKVLFTNAHPHMLKSLLSCTLRICVSHSRCYSLEFTFTLFHVPKIIPWTWLYTSSNILTYIHHINKKRHTHIHTISILLYVH